MTERNFVLVTGSPRSGTTVVGELLSLRADSFYLYEPMNFHSGDAAINTYFAVPGSTDLPPAAAKDLVARITSLNLKLKPGSWPHERGLKLLRKRLIGGRSRVSYAICRIHPMLRTVIWKDPFAFFAIPFLLEETSMPIVVTRRPVGGIAASFKRFGWGFELEGLLNRLNDPSMPESILDGYDITDPVTNAAFLWNIMERKSKEFARHERVKVVDIPTLVDKPVEVTRSLYEHCKLKFDGNIAGKVQKRYTRTGGDAIPQGNTAHVKKRDINAVNTYWKSLLNDDEKETIAKVAERFDS